MGIGPVHCNFLSCCCLFYWRGFGFMEINRLIHAKCEVVFWQLSFMSVSYGKCCFLLGTCLPAFFFFFNADSKFYLDKYQFKHNPKCSYRRRCKLLWRCWRCLTHTNLGYVPLMLIALFCTWTPICLSRSSETVVALKLWFILKQALMFYLITMEI